MCMRHYKHYYQLLKNILKILNIRWWHSFLLPFSDRGKTGPGHASNLYHACGTTNTTATVIEYREYHLHSEMAVLGGVTIGWIVADTESKFDFYAGSSSSSSTKRLAKVIKGTRLYGKLESDIRIRARSYVFPLFRNMYVTGMLFCRINNPRQINFNTR